MNYLEWEGLVALAVAIIGPLIWKDVMLFNPGLILIAFVHTIVSLVKRRFWQGLLLLLLSCLAVFVFYKSLPPLY